MLNILTVIGTRPEAIKMAPLISELKSRPNIKHTLCVSGQHNELLYQALNVFGLIPDFDLKIMTSNQTLSEITSKILLAMNDIFKTVNPHIILVHGDTTTSFATALSGFYNKIPVGHIEAGLRTHNIWNPFPEEINRSLNAKLATWHFAPTIANKQNLINEGVEESKIYVTGNTVIDALISVSNKINDCPEELKSIKDVLNNRFILVTGHRRENFGDGFKNICESLSIIAARYPDVNIVYPVHLNPNVKNIVHEKLSHIPNIHLIDPVPYIPFVFLMKKCCLILTDSGGVQEEAPSLNKPVLVMREFTERTEAIEAGTVKLVGTDILKITDNVDFYLNYNKEYVVDNNPYGNGDASRKIANILETLC